MRSQEWYKKRTGPHINLANLVREKRESMGINQQKLADLAGLHVNAIRHVESGRDWPQLETFQLLADALNVPIDDLMRAK